MTIIKKKFRQQKEGKPENKNNQGRSYEVREYE